MSVKITNILFKMIFMHGFLSPKYSYPSDYRSIKCHPDPKEFSTPSKLIESVQI